MRPHTLLLNLAIVALAGCAARVAGGDAAPIAPPDGSDRASIAPSTRVEVAGLPAWLRIRLADYDAQARPAAPQAVFELRYGDGVLKGLRHPQWPVEPWDALRRLVLMMLQALKPEGVQAGLVLRT